MPISHDSVGFQVFSFVGFEILCAFCGIGAATISFTAWCIVLPFLYICLNFPLEKALFLSILSDFTSCTFCTIRFAFKRKVIFSTWWFGVFQIPIGLATSLYLGPFLLKFSRFLKRNMNTMMFLMAGFYFIRFIMFFSVDVYRKIKTRNKDKKFSLVGQWMTFKPTKALNIQNNGSVPRSSLDIKKKETEDPKPIFAHIAPLLPKEEVSGPRPVRENVRTGLSQFTVEDGAGIFNQEEKFGKGGLIFRHCFFGFWIIITSVLGGFIKNSCGLNYNMFIQIAYKQKQVVSTATGCFLAMILCIGVMLSYISMPQYFDYEMLLYGQLCVMCSILGCVIGITFMFLLSEMYIYLMIGVICLVLGIIPYLLEAIEG